MKKSANFYSSHRGFLSTVVFLAALFGVGAVSFKYASATACDNYLARFDLANYSCTGGKLGYDRVPVTVADLISTTAGAFLSLVVLLATTGTLLFAAYWWRKHDSQPARGNPKSVR